MIFSAVALCFQSSLIVVLFASSSLLVFCLKVGRVRGAGGGTPNSRKFAGKTPKKSSATISSQGKTPSQSMSPTTVKSPVQKKEKKVFKLFNFLKLKKAKKEESKKEVQPEPEKEEPKPAEPEKGEPKPKMKVKTDDGLKTYEDINSNWTTEDELMKKKRRESLAQGNGQTPSQTPTQTPGATPEKKPVQLSQQPPNQEAKPVPPPESKPKPPLTVKVSLTDTGHYVCDDEGASTKGLEFVEGSGTWKGLNIKKELKRTGHGLGKPRMSGIVAARKEKETKRMKMKKMLFGKKGDKKKNKMSVTPSGKLSGVELERNALKV